MRHEHDKARHHAEATLAAVNADLANPKTVNNARRRHMLTDMKEKAMRTIESHNRMYGDRSDRYTSDDDLNDYRGDYRNNRRNDRYNDYRNDNRMDMVNDAMDLVDRILPHVTGDDYDDVVDRRGVFRGGGGRRDHRKTARTRRYGRRAAMDDWQDDDRADYDDMARAAADAAAETARRMMNNRRNDVYPPHTPIMPRQDEARYDARGDRNDRADRTTHNDTGIGPGSTRR